MRTVPAALIAVAAVAGLAAPAAAQTWNFEDAVYLSCREAHALPPDQRISLAIFLGEHAAAHHGVMLPEGEDGAALALLIRGGCTLSPDAYLFTVIDRAITAELPNLPRR
jgi:hypothetical protein